MNYLSRLEKLQERLSTLSCDVLLLEHPTDLFYLTGMELSSGRLLVKKQSSDLFVDGRYIEICKKDSPCPARLLTETDFLSSLPPKSTIGFDSVHTTYRDTYRFQEWSEKCPSVSFIPIENPIQTLREVKDREEISLLRQAAQLDVKGFEFVCSLLEEGISEVEIATELEIFWKKQGGRKVSFDPIIAFGNNSSMPHYRSGTTKLEYGMSVLIDIGVTLNHYQSDLTRVVFFGPPNEKMTEIYAIVEEAQQRALSLCRPGVSVGELDSAARSYIAEKGYGDAFLHSLGHGIGLDTHEPPILRNKPPFQEKLLKEGFVITIEPGIYLPGVGGVRLEDTIAITATGYEILTRP